MKWILITVDGTDSSDWRKPGGENSHVHTFYRKFGNGYGGSELVKFFQDGPDWTITGLDSGSKRQAGLNKIFESIDRFFPEIPIIEKPTMLPGGAMNITSTTVWNSYFNFEKQRNERYRSIRSFDHLRIVLVGHSRGGGVVIDIAQKLSEHKIPVYFMGLFDGVDRSLFISGGDVVNTRHAYHALRGLENSRSSFGNTGKAGTIYKVFDTSHGGIGGSPEAVPTTITSDFSCSVLFIPSSISIDKIKEQFKSRIQHYMKCKNESLKAYEWMVEKARYCGLPI